MWNEHVRAILVGVTDYSALPGTPDLPYGREDVKMMATALAAGLHVNPLHIWTKTANADAGKITRQSFLEGIRLFLSDCTPDDILIFYFSGHGQIRDGKHWLIFSDGAIETQSVIDLFCSYHVDKKIILLDCCMSGLYAIHDYRGSDDHTNSFENRELQDNIRQDAGGWIQDLLKGGTAVFASGRSDELSGYNRKSSASVFTTFLWNAMTNRFYLENGKLSLDKIRELVYREADAWNERNPDRAQHPVFRSSIDGPVYFRVAEDFSYRQQGFSLDLPDYRIVSVAPLHSGIAKRYVVKVILKRHVKESELIRINREIVTLVRPLELYKSEKEKRRWQKHPADLIFTYYGYSNRDITQGNYEIYTVWASETQDRSHWYRTQPDSKVLGGILIRRNPAYGWVLNFIQENTAEDSRLFTEEELLIRGMIENGKILLQIWQEGMNRGQLTKEEMAVLKKTCREIDEKYVAVSELLIPSERLEAWDRAAMNVAGDIEDFSICMKELDEGRSFDSTGVLMSEITQRYHADLDRLAAQYSAFIKTM